MSTIQLPWNCEITVIEKLSRLETSNVAQALGMGRNTSETRFHSNKTVAMATKNGVSVLQTVLATECGNNHHLKKLCMHCYHGNRLTTKEYQACPTLSGYNSSIIV